MTTFSWQDRRGIVHDLTGHEAIERERLDVRQELLDLRTRIESADDAVFMTAHGETVVLRARLVALQADLQAFVRHEAARATTMIGQIDLEADFLRALHRSYEQRVERGDDDAALAKPPTPDQVAVLRRQAIRDGRTASIPDTFGDAHTALLACPATCRTPLPDTAPGLEWTDRHQDYHQVRDLRQIEREYVAVANELALVRPQLAPEVPIRDVLKALEHSRLALDRVSLLERTMNRWSAHVISVVRGEHVTFLDDLEKSDGRNV